MDIVVLAVVIAMSLTSLPLAVVINALKLKDFRLVYLASALCYVAGAVVSVLVFRRRYRSVHFIIYVFAAFCWTSCLDLFTALEMDGFIKTFIGSYFVEGEPYMNTSHVFMTMYWDGTAHFLLQLSGIVLFSMQESFREVGLYWCGSIINFMLVVVIGAVLGRSEIKWAYFANMPYVAILLITAFKLLRERPLQARSYLRVAPITRRPADLFFLLYFVFAFGLAIFRGLIALGAEFPCLMDYVITFEPYLSDLSTFPKVQMLVYMFYFGFYYLCCIDGLLNPGQLWMSDWSLIHAGAAAQSQFVYMSSAIHPHTPRNFRAPQGGIGAAVFWGINLILLVAPHLFAWRCWRDPDYYGRTYTVDMARPLSKAPSRHNYRTPTKQD